MSESDRIVITGVGLTAPNGNSLDEFRRNHVIRSREDWGRWIGYLAGSELSRRGVQRGKDGLLGQIKRVRY